VRLPSTKEINPGLLHRKRRCRKASQQGKRRLLPPYCPARSRRKKEPLYPRSEKEENLAFICKKGGDFLEKGKKGPCFHIEGEKAPRPQRKEKRRGTANKVPIEKERSSDTRLNRGGNTKKAKEKNIPSALPSWGKN